MSSRKTIVAATFFLVAVFLIFYLVRVPKNRVRSTKDNSTLTPPVPRTLPRSDPGTQQASHSPQNTKLQRQKTVADVLTMLATRITFYGRVVDQNGDPVRGADIDYGAIDRFDESGSDYHGKSDDNGNFSLAGIHGAVLTVGVRKSGYYNIHGKSDAAFAYGVGIDPTRKAPPTKDNPAVFVLQKQGSTEPLIRAGGGQIDVSRDGQALHFDFATGKAGRGDLQIQTWIGDSKQHRFDWSYRLSIPGGGLTERTGQFDFEAPAEGYQPALELKMPSMAEKWSSDIPKEYFAKLPNDRYARFSIEFYAGDRNFVVLTSYLNPEPGHRNLEFDPTKQIKVK
jgi:hypothetical protein